MSTSVGSTVHLHVTSFHPPDSVISLCSFTCKQLDQDHTRCWWKRNQFSSVQSLSHVRLFVTPWIAVLSKYKFLTLNHYRLQRAYWLNFSSSLESSGSSAYLYQGAWGSNKGISFPPNQVLSVHHVPASCSSKREKKKLGLGYFFFLL